MRRRQERRRAHARSLACGARESLDHRAGVARQDQLALRPDRRNAIRHESLVEFAQRELRAHTLLVVGAELENSALAEEIAAVGRIVGTALGLSLCSRRGDVRLLL